MPRHTLTPAASWNTLLSNSDVSDHASDISDEDRMSRQIIDPLLEPFVLKNVTLRNRVVSTSHEPAYAEDGMPKDRYRLYHLEKARGRRRPDHDRRVRGRRPGQSAGVRQPAALQGRDRPLAATADRRRARRGAGGDVPGDPPRTPYQQLHRRLASRRSTPRPCGSRRTAAFPKVAEPWDLDRIVDDYVSAPRAGAARPASTASSWSPTGTCSTASCPRHQPTAATSSAGASSTGWPSRDG